MYRHHKAHASCFQKCNMLPLAVRRTSQTSLLGPYDPTVASWTMPTRGGSAAEQGASSGHDAENWAAQMR